MTPKTSFGGILVFIHTRIVRGTRFDWVVSAEKCHSIIWFGSLDTQFAFTLQTSRKLTETPSFQAARVHLFDPHPSAHEHSHQSKTNRTVPSVDACQASFQDDKI